MDEFEEIPKYKKKAKKAKKVYHKKADHTHRYDYCVYEYDIPVYNEVHGMITKRKFAIGTYCPICGKIGARFVRDDKYSKHTDKCAGHFHFVGHEWNDKALKEFNPETRTLPYAFLEDMFTTKYVNLEKLYDYKNQSQT